MSYADQTKVARQQYLYAKRNETRVRFKLMADAEIARLLPDWELEFDTKAREQMPAVLDLHSELRRLSAGS